MRLSRSGTIAAVLLGTLMSAGVRGADNPAQEASNKLAHDIYKQLIEINTTDSAGNVTSAAQAMAKRFRDAGFPAADVMLLGPTDTKKNLVVRLRGTGAHKPMLLLGHLDVVEAPREDWATDPFQLVEKDGYFYGRGTLDMKNGDAIMVATLIGMKQHGFRPARDIILALTAGEESGIANGAQWLFANHRELLDAEFVLNQDDWSIPTEPGKPLVLKLIASEKLYADYQLVVTNPGGHSSEPVPDNAIYALAAGVNRLAAYEFPFELNSVTRAYYERRATVESGQRAADMRALLKDPPEPQAIRRLSASTLDRGMVHTTCVATRLQAGHANNALPQRAEAVVNCRILPGHSAEEIRHTLVGIVADPRIAVRYIASDGQVSAIAPNASALPAAKLSPAIIEPLQRIAAEIWPQIHVIPVLDIAASDSVYAMAAGLPTYTFGAVTFDANDDRAHGLNERLGVESFYKDNEFFARYLRAITER
jgi:acetylornithine deacetylase/succinyl-diaminopimelate desuccinylase-like protein